MSISEEAPRPPPTRPAEESIWQQIKRSPGTTALIAANVVLFTLAERSGNTQSIATLMQFGACERSAVWSGQYWRLFSAIFLHIGIVHLIWNCYAMLSLCAAVERSLGLRRFLFAYVASGLVASAASVLGHDVVSAGASGAGFGMIGLLLALRYRLLGSAKAFAADRPVRRTLGMMVIWLVLGATVVNMDNFAHLGGLFAGALLGLAFTRTFRMVLVTTGALALFVGSSLVPWPGWRAAHQTSARLDDALRIDPKNADALAGRAAAQERAAH